eukprot:TRINITY_DN870_c0_g1_i1.p1 TRINITY_DN870_c0_g1~~TRINITY_DN870_c0_g1_i1.p1  ORF type:complete len:107 (-),score=17.33 TRINITY_DN870_c0_g1_i1:602-922(-)
MSKSFESERGMINEWLKHYDVVYKDWMMDLNITNKGITELPLYFGNCFENLTRLDCYGNKLIDLPDSVGQLSSLNYLSLYKNQIKEIPDCVCNSLLSIYYTLIITK